LTEEKKEVGSRNAEVGKEREQNAKFGILEQSAEGIAGWTQAQRNN
jgi:hypothetical protein